MRHLLIVILLALLVGCTPATRYRTGGAVNGEQATIAKTSNGYTTNDFLKLGGIMQSYLGKPYGSAKYDAGLDCSSFVRDVFRKFDGRQLPRRSADQFGVGNKTERRKLAYGDLVFFRTVGSGVSHVGIFVGNGDFIHVSSSRGVIVTPMNEEYWAKRYVGAKRILIRKTES